VTNDKKKIRDVMTTDPATVEASESVVEAARLMDERSIGDVLVVRGEELVGVLTDRDIVVRCIARGGDPSSDTVEQCCSSSVATVGPDSDTDEVVQLMVQKAIRRIPVVEGKRPVGVVSIGDLAEHLDRRSALGAISAAPPNN
jgi:CBS domain-containing protein